MNASSDAPQARFYKSQGLRLHYTDWGNPSAPPLILIHGGLDHSRSWDPVAQALRTILSRHRPGPARPRRFRMGQRQQLQPGRSRLRSDRPGRKPKAWTRLRSSRHSMGGMVSLTYAGAFPEKVSRLAVLDGVTNFPARTGEADRCPHRRMGRRSRQGGSNAKSTATIPWPKAPSACGAAMRG